MRATRDDSGWKTEEPTPTSATASRMAAKLGAIDSSTSPARARRMRRRWLQRLVWPGPWGNRLAGRLPFKKSVHQLSETLGNFIIREARGFWFEIERNGRYNFPFPIDMIDQSVTSTFPNWPLTPILILNTPSPTR